MLAKERPSHDRAATKRFTIGDLQFNVDLGTRRDLVTQNHANPAIRKIFAGAVEVLAVMINDNISLEWKTFNLALCRP
jgi:hypothetical protein